MRKRQTVPVAELVRRTNRMLAAPGSTREGRQALASLLEEVLQQTGQYKGFGYQPSEYLPATEQTDTNVLRAGYDDTRRRYYGAHAS